MRVLITGVDGFTGRHLARHLHKEGWEVWGLSRSAGGRERTVECDIRDEEGIYRALERIRPEYIVHLAAVAFVADEDAAGMYATNVFGTQAILEATAKLPKKPKRLLFASSATVYGNQKSAVLHEKMCPRPLQHYGYTKFVGERMVEALEGVETVVARPFNYTGVGQDERFVIPKIVAHFRAGARTIELGNLDVYREYNDVRYVVECYRRLLLCPGDVGVVNVASGEAVSLAEVLATMERIAGYRIEVRVNPKFVRKNEIVSLAGDTEKLARTIELPPKPSLEETLRWMCEA